MAQLALKQVETGTQAFSSSDTSQTITLGTAVDRSKSIVFVDSTSGTHVAQQNAYRAALSSDGTTLTLARGNGAGVTAAATVRYTVVEFSAGVTVQWIESTSFNSDVLIPTAVDTARTALLFNYEVNSAFNTSNDFNAGCTLVDSNNVRVNVGQGQSSFSWVAQVIEFDSDSGVTVEAATLTVADGTSSQTATIGSVDPNTSIILASVYGGDSDNQAADYCFEPEIVDATTVKVTRNTASTGLNTPPVIYAFVLDFGTLADVRTGAGAITFAQGTAVSASFTAIDNTAKAVAFRSGGDLAIGQYSGSQLPLTLTRVSLDSTTGLTITRDDGADDLDSIRWQVLAFKGSVDTTPPTLSAVTATSTGQTTADVGATSSEDGNGYAVILTSGATAPTGQEVKAGTGSGGAAAVASGSNLSVTASTPFTIGVTGLSAATTYDVYVTAEDASDNVQGTPLSTTVTTDAVAPTLSTATANATTLTLTYDQTLDSGSVPATGDFTVTGSVSGAISVSNVGVSGTDVTLTLAASARPNETVTLDYTPGVSPIQNGDGTDAASLSGQAVTNNTPDPVVTVTHQVDGSALGSGITVTTVFYPQDTLDGASQALGDGLRVTGTTDGSGQIAYTLTGFTELSGESVSVWSVITSGANAGKGEAVEGAAVD